MKRREFLSLLGGAAAPRCFGRGACVLATGTAGDRRSCPRSGSAEGAAHLVAALRQGLREAGLIEGQNVAIEFTGRTIAPIDCRRSPPGSPAVRCR